MANFINKITGGDSKKEQGNCCGVEIQEVTSEQEKQNDGCCTPSTDDNNSRCC